MHWAGSGTEARAALSETTKRRLRYVAAAARTWIEQQPRWIGPLITLRRRRSYHRFTAALRVGSRVAEWTRAHPALATPAAMALVVGLVYTEVRTSLFEAHLLSGLISGSTYRVQSGPSPRVRFPTVGPYDERLGYTRLPRMIARLEHRGFDINAQARVTRRFAALSDALGIRPFREKSQTGIDLRDRTGQQLYRARHPRHVYASFEAVPSLVVRSLLHLENRELLNENRLYHNPAVEWDRLSAAAANLTQARLVGSERVFGASTLATQMEKYRHSPGGVTHTALDKARQMMSASFRAYLDGPVTVNVRRRVVTDYINSLPIGAAPGHGEVIGLGDGLWAWFGLDFRDANRLLITSDSAALVTEDEAYVYRAALSLLLAQRRPAFYLRHPRGQRALALMTDKHVRAMMRRGVISVALGEKALAVRATPLARAPEAPAIPFDEHKAANAIRIRLLELLGTQSLHQLDKYDLTVRSTVDATAQHAVAERLQRLGDPEYVRTLGLDGPRLLGSGDPAAMVYSVALYERTPFGNAVRIQTDNLNAPFDLNAGARLELGSTAKLRTLITYLETVEELHGQLAAVRTLPGAEASSGFPADPITRWAIDFHQRHPDHTLLDMLEAALQRPYSASPYERFFTGEGVHSFKNFDPASNSLTPTVEHAFAHSINLVFVRLMRDIVWYEANRVAPLWPDTAEAAALLATHPRGRDRARFIALEKAAFQHILTSWRRTGYPYGDMVPSLATAIGSSGDRPEALSELVGILLNDGVRLPFVHLEELRFAMRTPYETALRPVPKTGERVLSPEVAAAARAALAGVVQTGTARMLRNTLRTADGAVLAIGGKTGTGENRVKVFAPSLRVIETRSINRTASFVFFIGDRFFGAVTAYVPGPESAGYEFTSSLPVRLLRMLLDDLKPILLAPPPAD